MGQLNTYKCLYIYIGIHIYTYIYGGKKLQVEKSTQKVPRTRGT